MQVYLVIIFIDSVFNRFIAKSIILTVNVIMIKSLKANTSCLTTLKDVYKYRYANSCIAVGHRGMGVTFDNDQEKIE